MSRAARTGRGTIGAAFATLLAASSHSLAGGEVSAISVLITALIALPMCVALAGRAGSLWRTALAIGASQFMYHWAFAGIGSAQYLADGTQTDMFVSSHAAHMAAMQQFVPTVLEAGAADAMMWILHGVAAVISTLAVWRGEHAILALFRAMWHALPQPIVRHEISVPRAILASVRSRVLRAQVLSWGGRTLRGPPATA